MPLSYFLMRLVSYHTSIYLYFLEFRGALHHTMYRRACLPFKVYGYLWWQWFHPCHYLIYIFTSLYQQSSSTTVTAKIKDHTNKNSILVKSFKVPILQPELVWSKIRFYPTHPDISHHITPRKRLECRAEIFRPLESTGDPSQSWKTSGFSRPLKSHCNFNMRNSV